MPPANRGRFSARSYDYSYREIALIRSLLAVTATVLLVNSEYAAFANDESSTIKLSSLDGRQTLLQSEDIKVLPTTTVLQKQHGAVHTFDGPLLIDVLRKADVRGKASQHDELLDISRIMGRDGYTVI